MLFLAALGGSIGALIGYLFSLCGEHNRGPLSARRPEPHPSSEVRTMKPIELRAGLANSDSSLSGFSA